MDSTEPSQNISIATVVETASPSESVTAKTLVDLSIQHIQSAALYARLCAEVENKYQQRMLSLPPDAWDEMLAEHNAHAISSIFAAVAFLEGTSNKFFVDTAEQLSGIINRLSTSIAEIKDSGLLDNATAGTLLANMASSVLALNERGNVLEKFDKALVSCGKEKLNGKEELVRDISRLINLRNALTHYKPEWITLFTDTPLPDMVKPRLIEELRQKQIQRNPLIPVSERQFFPSGCLSHGHAKWAVNISIQFVEEFFRKMNLPCPFDHVKHRLKTEA